MTVPSVPVKTPPPPPPLIPVKAPPVTTSTPVKAPVPLRPPALSTPSVKAPLPSSTPGTAPAPVLPVAAAPRAVRDTLTRVAGAASARTAGIGRSPASAELATGIPAAGALGGFSPLLEGSRALVSSAQGGTPPLSPSAALRLLARGRIALGDPRLRSLVRRLETCLPLLPARLRTVLRLRTGVGASRRLSARATARLLHIRRKRLATLEVRALRLLSRTARTRGCGLPAASGPRFLSVGYLSFPGSSAQTPAGGVAGGLYLKAPSDTGAESVPPAEVIPGSPLQARPTSSGQTFWEAAVAALVGVLLVAWVVRDDMGLGPLRTRRRRRRPGGGDGGA